jgi:AI-2 transport protein TqsA
MAIKTWMSLATGIAVFIWLVIIGVNYAVLWGLLAFFLNYVPNIGSIIAAIPAVLLALIQLGLVKSIIVAGGFTVINLLIGNVIEPRFMGRGLGLSTLVVFLSLLFWGWVLGPVGMLLSVPLTMTAKIALDSRDETRWLAILLGPEIPAKHETPTTDETEIIEHP